MAATTPSVVLIDASIYIFRAWFTLPDSIEDAQGYPANAVYGFADFLAKLLDGTHPRHIACAFDTSLTHSFRNEIYPAYKANREKTPQELKRQFAGCRAISEALGVKTVSSRRYEADDLIGSLARRMREAGHRVTVVSGDKDLAQVIRPGDVWWNLARDQRLDYLGITRHMGVRPEQIPALLALAGDAVDNIPGVPGIGLKTAARLLRRFDDVDDLLDGVDTVARMKFRGAARVRGLLVQHAQQLRLARRLTPVATHAPVARSPAALAWRGYRPRKMAALFTHYGFSPAKRRRWETLRPR